MRFDLLHPSSGSYAVDGLKSNDRSCVLKISAARGSVLLTGDIEARSERELLERVPGELRADVLVVPHHGSRTSSTDEFIAAVSPRWAVFTVGYRNRLGHPKEEVLERYRLSGAQLLRTDSAGAVLVRLDDEGADVQSYREVRMRYWYAQ